MNKWIRRIKNYRFYLLNFKANIKYLFQYNMYSMEKERTWLLSNKIIDDVIYEYEEDKYLCTFLDILDQKESIQILVDQPKSFVRYGDGEIYLMQGHNQPFQKYDPMLAKRLKEILASRDSNLYIGINRAYFHSPVGFGTNNRKFYRINSHKFRQFFLEYCTPSMQYLDAGCFGAYYRFDDHFDYASHYSSMENLFRGKKVAIVCGAGILDKLTFDLFHLASEKQIIYGRAIDAFDEYDSLLKQITAQVSKDTLVCAILGMTAKVLCYDLTTQGYMAWDMGHAAKDYDAYMNKYEKNQENITRFWAPD